MPKQYILVSNPMNAKQPRELLRPKVITNTSIYSAEKWCAKMQVSQIIIAILLCNPKIAGSREPLCQ